MEGEARLRNVVVLFEPIFLQFTVATLGRMIRFAAFRLLRLTSMVTVVAMSAAQRAIPFDVQLISGPRFSFRQNRDEH